MKIKEFTVKNYKNIGIDELCTIKFPNKADGQSDMLTIIGENNIGKSTVLEALRMFFPYEKPHCPDLDRFPKKVEPNPLNEDEHMEICVTFHKFTEQDLNKIEISRYIYNEELKIKRLWKSSNLNDKDVPYYAYIQQAYIHELEGKPTWNNTAFQDVSEELRDLRQRFCAEQGLTGTIPAAKKEDFLQYVLEENSALVHHRNPEWMANPNGLSSVLRSIMPKVIYIPAMKLLQDETNPTKTNSAAKNIMSSLIEKKMRTSQKFVEFETAATNLTNAFVGEDRHESLNSLETSLNLKLKRLMDIEAKVNFSPPVIEKLHENTTFSLIYNDIETTTDHQGSGAQRLLILSLLELMSQELDETVEEVENSWQRSYLFLVEEPEIYLHPQLQRKMRDSLLKISESELSQVICTSHSEHFIDLADRHQGIVIAKRNFTTGTTLFSQVEENLYNGENALDKRNAMRMLLNFNSSTLESFFSRRVILVEGDCEIASFKSIKDVLISKYPDKKEDIESYCKDINIISCKGKLTQRTYCEVLTHFGIEPVIIHDLDGELYNSGNNLRMLESINLDETRRLYHSPNFEEDIFGEEWLNDKPWKATKLISERFDQYEEGLLRFFNFVIGKEAADSLNIDSLVSSEI
ncbi:AAA family ATPase [Psychrobacillus lasiicapitis]|uniref:OLD family endonuclease n=1 Tax=Psychrobacillus lasiicapitis TaxID=1636719 RepID=A0A544SS24_9BACI|nr:AAA family ATPase [Psychrobacillus lasiicapitis]TQR08011.1 OLD family endonuclease [Psychrobacillus lasiicapitis]GGA49983.1 ATP-dependent endonuclease [Psychrobacillus lasiicapitis]